MSDNTANHNEFFRLTETPIEPGLVLVLIQLEKLWEDCEPGKFEILHDWLVDSLGTPTLAAYICQCYPNSNDEDYDDNASYFRVPEEFLEILQNAK